MICLCLRSVLCLASQSFIISISGYLLFAGILYYFFMFNLIILAKGFLLIFWFPMGWGNSSFHHSLNLFVIHICSWQKPRVSIFMGYLRLLTTLELMIYQMNPHPPDATPVHVKRLLIYDDCLNNRIYQTRFAFKFYHYIHVRKFFVRIAL